MPGWRRHTDDSCMRCKSLPCCEDEDTGIVTLIDGLKRIASGAAPTLCKLLNVSSITADTSVVQEQMDHAMCRENRYDCVLVFVRCRCCDCQCSHDNSSTVITLEPSFDVHLRITVQPCNFKRISCAYTFRPQRMS